MCLRLSVSSGVSDGHSGSSPRPLLQTRRTPGTSPLEKRLGASSEGSRTQCHPTPGGHAWIWVGTQPYTQGTQQVGPHACSTRAHSGGRAKDWEAPQQAKTS